MSIVLRMAAKGNEMGIFEKQKALLDAKARQGFL
jgi:hypothetical protein